jgi:titin
LLSAAAQQVTRNVLDRLINPPLDPPTAPTGLTATAGTSISLAWLDNATTETGYEVERAISTGSFTLLARLGANARSYTDASVTRRTSHKYRVRAYNAGGASAYSNTVTVKSK